jgi:hypothetical protein
MYNPLSPDQIGANTFAAVTGVKAYQNGATGWEATNIGLWWRWWYKNLGFALVILVCFAVPIIGYALPQNTNPNIPHDTSTLPWGIYLLAAIQVLVTVWVFSLTYVSLIDVSGFKRRLWYKLWAGIQHRLVPNVARFWWYLMILFPMWVTVWYIAFFVNKTGIQPGGTGGTGTSWKPAEW